ncbi:MAG: Gfo/Idh/MocA family oxidoreductase, partial [Gemmataceae bacterium]|nr:Gfo/Idh/MocA family oxidoreductase [Gemmataceae bacterium]
TAGALVATGLPTWYVQELLVHAQETAARRPVGANDRIVMAAIGTGTNRTRRGSGQLHGERGFHIMQDAMRQPGVQMVAVCDVDRPNAEFAANYVRNAPQGGTRECRIYGDYRELLQDRSIDAITIGTPDHWHAAIAIAAMRAGKDVYCEKPLTLTIEEGKVMARVARETNRIVQTGTQQRTEMAGRFRLACELVRNGRIGHVRQITTLIGANPVGGPFPEQPVPEGLNYDFWLGQAPREPYTTNRCHYEFRWWYQYSGGKMTDWGAHHNDIAQWALGMDESGPVTVQGSGTAPSTDRMSYNCHPQFEAIFTYANGRNGMPGTRLICRHGPRPDFIARNGNRPYDNGVLFEGEDNKWIFVSRSTIIASDRALIDEPLPQNAIRLGSGTSHMANFLECVRSRRQPVSNATVGHRSCTVCHLGNIAIRFFPNQLLTWNPQEERFTGERSEEANRHLSRPRREGYELGA